MVNIGDLTKLLDQGFLEGEYTYQSEIGDYKFKFRTLTPYSDVEAYRDADAKFVRDNNTNEADRIVYRAIEVLARAVQTVNETPLENIPGSKGETSLDKKIFVMKSLGEKILTPLWTEYLTLRGQLNPKGSKEEDDSVKKS